MWKLQYPTLTAFAVDDLETVPGIADAWTANADGHGYAYTLGAATWSDGQPVTAADVVSSLRRARDEDWPSAAGLLDGLDARVVDDRTVEITTTGEIGALPTLPLHIVPESGDSKVSAGDFVVTAADDSEVRMEVIDRPGRPALDEIVFRSYSDAAALEHALGRGDVDIAAGFANDDLAAVQRDRRCDRDPQQRRRPVVPASCASATRSSGRPSRRAIDRDTLVGSAVAGVGRPAVAPIVARGQEWQLDDAEVQTLAEQLRFAPDDAKALVQQLATVPTLTLAAPDDAVGDAIADSVIAALDAVGVTVERVGGGAPADLTVARRDPTDDPTAALAQYTCSAGIWCDARYDAAFAQYSATSDPATRQAAARTMVRRLTDGLPEIVLFAPDELQAYRVDNVAGIQRDPDVSRLVVFWPSAEQYRGMVPAAAAASEELPAVTFAALALASAAVVAAGVVVIDRRIQARR